MKKIYAICATLNGGYDSDELAIANSGIQIGDKIEVKNASVGKWHTKVWLAGHKESFNSVFFKFVDENGEGYDLFEDENFRSYSR